MLEKKTKVLQLCGEPLGTTWHKHLRNNYLAKKFQSGMDASPPTDPCPNVPESETEITMRIFSQVVE